MPRTTDVEYRVQEFPLCVSGEEILSDTGWIPVEKTSVPLDDFGELKAPAEVSPDLDVNVRSLRRRHQKHWRPFRERMPFPREGQSKALLRSFFW